jgi:hypothetical protein
MSYNPSSSSSNLLSGLEGQISADEEPTPTAAAPQRSFSSSAPPPPSALGSVQTSGSGSADKDASVLSQSAHPVALIFLYLFRVAAIATYLLCGFFSSSYVFSVSVLRLLERVER